MGLPYMLSEYDLRTLGIAAHNWCMPCWKTKGHQTRSCLVSTTGHVAITKYEPAIKPLQFSGGTITLDMMLGNVL